MTVHDNYEILLAVRADLSSEEQTELDAHVAECAQCQERLAVYTEQDRVIQGLPHGLLLQSERDAVVTQAMGGVNGVNPMRPVPAWNEGRTRQQPAAFRLEANLCQAEPAPTGASRSNHRRTGLAAFFRRPLSGLASAVAAAAVVLAVVLHPWQPSATPASAADLLRAAVQAAAQQFPYTGTSEVSFTALPQYTLPDTAARATGRHRAVVQWAVRDASHFRVVIHTMLPALDAGLETVVVNGEKIYRYDTRTETAAVGTLYPLVRDSFSSQLLPILRNGGEYGSAPEPDPAQSIQRYLAQGEQARAKVHGYVRLVGHGRMLGRRVDIVEFAPLIVSCDQGARDNTCAVPTHGYGVGRAWIDHAHPFILQYREYGFSGLHDLHTERLNFTYRVTSVHYQSAPSAAELSFRPPVPIRNAGHWTIGSMEGTDLPHNGQFLYAPSPTKYSHLDWVTPAGMGGGQVIGPLQRVTRATMLYSVRGRHEITYLHKGDRYGFGLFIVGPYLYVQERTQVHGLPPALRTGKVEALSGCTMWLRAAPSGGLRISFQHGTTSVEVVEAGMSRAELMHYVYHELCAPRWK